MGKEWKQCQTLLFGGSKIIADGDCSHEIKRHLHLRRKVMTNLDSIFKIRDITLPIKVCLVKAMVFPVVMKWELGCEESWAPNNWCFWTVVLEKTLESSLDCKEIQPVHAKGDQSWVFIGGTDVEAETPILWPLDAESWLIEKDPDAGRDWEQEKEMTEDEMAWWHHWLNAHEGEGEVTQSCLTLCNPVDYSLPGFSSMGFSRQEYWSGLPFPSAGDLPDPGIEPGSPTLEVDALTSGSWWWSGRPGMLRFMGLQRVRQDWATELNWNNKMEV